MSDLTEVASEVGSCGSSTGWPCDDGNGCTIDQCVDNQCVYTP